MWDDIFDAVTEGLIQNGAGRGDGRQLRKILFWLIFLTLIGLAVYFLFFF